MAVRMRVNTYYTYTCYCWFLSGFVFPVWILPTPDNDSPPLCYDATQAPLPDSTGELKIKFLIIENDSTTFELKWACPTWQLTLMDTKEFFFIVFWYFRDQATSTGTPWRLVSLRDRPKITKTMGFSCSIFMMISKINLKNIFVFIGTIFWKKL